MFFFIISPNTNIRYILHHINPFTSSRCTAVLLVGQHLVNLRVEDVNLVLNVLVGRRTGLLQLDGYGGHSGHVLTREADLEL